MIFKGGAFGLRLLSMNEAVDPLYIFKFLLSRHCGSKLNQPAFLLSLSQAVSARQCRPAASGDLSMHQQSNTDVLLVTATTPLLDTRISIVNGNLSMSLQACTTSAPSTLAQRAYCTCLVWADQLIS